MNTQYRRVLPLMAVAVLALALTLVLSSGDTARAMLQVSPLPTETPALVTVEPIDLGAATLEAPTSVPLPPAFGATATPRGFLPAPTIVNPNDLKSLPLAQPQIAGSSSLPEPTATPRAAAGNTGVRALVAFLNYLWLLCGALLLIGGAGAIILLWRRGQRN